MKNLILLITTIAIIIFLLMQKIDSKTSIKINKDKLFTGENPQSLIIP